MTFRNWICILAVISFAVLAIPVRVAAQHHHYKLIVVETLGGPQSYGDPGHGAANINNEGMAVGVADTAIPDPFYPLYNPGFAGGIGLDPYIYHGFIAKGSTLVDLGGLPGGTDSEVSYLTGNGLVSGQALDGSIDPIFGWQAEKAVVWINGKIINLGTLGGYESAAGQINSRGQVTGIATNTVSDPFSFIYSGLSNGTQTRAFLWDETNGMQDIGTLGGPDAFAPFINESGQIAGFSYTSSTPNATTGLPTIDPFLWENGTMIDLGSLGGTVGAEGDRFSLNNHSQVVGSSNLAGDIYSHPFLWTPPGPMRDLGTLGGANGIANAINDTGEIVGYADRSPGAPTVADAFLWRNGSMTDLGTLDGDCFSGAFGINAHSQVVGQSITCDSTGFRAFLWEKGSMIDLNLFVPPGFNLTLTDVETINDRGEMFGVGTLADGNERAFLLIPCDENHLNIEGCDYTLMEGSAAMAGANAHVVGPSVRANHSPFGSQSRWPGLLNAPRHSPGLQLQK